MIIFLLQTVWTKIRPDIMDVGQQLTWTKAHWTKPHNGKTHLDKIQLGQKPTYMHLTGVWL